jgi:hypothetical protein
MINVINPLINFAVNNALLTCIYSMIFCDVLAVLIAAFVEEKV